MDKVPLKTLFNNAKKNNRKSNRYSVEHMCRSKQNIGIMNVSKVHCTTCKKKYMYLYNYKEHGEYKSFNSVDLNKLKQKAISKNLPWIITNQGKLDRILKKE